MNNLFIEYLLCAAYCLLFIFLIKKTGFFKLKDIPRTWVEGAFLLKVLCGIILIFIYTFYYPERHNADIYKYFDDGNILNNALWENPRDFLRIMFSIDNESPYFHRYYGQMNNWYGIYPTNLYGDGHIMIRFNALARIISFGSLPVHTAIMSFLSFTGLIALYRLASEILTSQKRLYFLFLFLFPSLLFWSSGVLKEGLIVFSTGMLLYHWYRIIKGQYSWWRVVFVLFSLAILRYSKFYLFGLFVPLILAFTWVELTKGKQILIKYFIVILLTIITGLSLHYFNPYNDIPQILSVKHNDFIKIALEQDAGSLFSEKPLDPSWTQLIKAAIPGFVNTLVRPLPGNNISWITLIPIIENILILLFIIYCLFNWKKPTHLNHFLFCILFVFACYSLAGIIAPVSGALVRYKVPALPFLIFALMQINGKKSLL